MSSSKQTLSPFKTFRSRQILSPIQSDLKLLPANHPEVQFYLKNLEEHEKRGFAGIAGDVFTVEGFKSHLAHFRNTPAPLRYFRLTQSDSQTYSKPISINAFASSTVPPTWQRNLPPSQRPQLGEANPVSSRPL